MNHPEIPTYCEMFFRDTDGEWWFSPNGKQDSMDSMESEFPCAMNVIRMQKIISAVAEVAWRKEADRFGSPSPSAEDFDRFHECCVKADEWREWGEQ